MKEEVDGKKRFKAILVVKGFDQKEGIDFAEIFSLVVKMTSIRTVLSLVAVEDLHLEQLDVKMPFFMVIWRKRYTWSNHTDTWSLARRKWCAG